MQQMCCQIRQARLTRIALRLTHMALKFERDARRSIKARSACPSREGSATVIMSNSSHGNHVWFAVGCRPTLTTFDLRKAGHLVARSAMNSQSRFAADTTAKSIAAAAKLTGGAAPGSIR